MLIDDDQYDMLYRRASYPVWLKFGINKAELRMLKQLSWYLKHRNATVVGFGAFCDVVTNNSVERVKMNGYLRGLMEKKFVGSYSYISNPGSLSVGLSDLGVEVLNCFREDLIKLRDKYPCSPYRLDQDVIPSFEQEPRARYVPRKQA